MSHSPLPVRNLAEVTASQLVLPKGQGVTKFKYAYKSEFLVQKRHLT
jgi:hypothetical protein